MLSLGLNVAGSEWIIIIFAALVLILGTNKLPEAAKKLGRAVNEYNKAKQDMQNQMKDYTSHDIGVKGPLGNERDKLEAIARSLGEDPSGKTTEQLKDLIQEKIGRRDDPGAA
ncbi:Sec-independent protein secretion pathway component [Cenarchaeum symbiosum A]|uniref:Sec-independent protein secretion pathway component n=1 Tax=Cenarchaeum symbiosum (strain A) TaxID=414004 RepID=A0RU06_CENSY|nr:Sec-independent protein secretion pathway component [Cenarchaeum symbiosum A]